MTKEQFINLLRTPATINLNMVTGLEEITERFPYFQNAHLLLAKQYQGHQNIRYESYIRKAAAYASDRRVLYELIQLEPEKVIHIEPEAEEKVRKEVRNVGPEAEIVREGVRESQGKVRESQERVRESQEKVREKVRNVGTDAEAVREEVRESQEKVKNVVDEEVIDADINVVELRAGILDAEIVEANLDEENTGIEDSDQEVPLILDEEEDVEAEMEEKVRDIEPIAEEKVREEDREKVREEVRGVEENVAEKTTDPKEIIAKRLRELERSKEQTKAPEVQKSAAEIESPSAKAEEITPVQKTEFIAPPASTEIEPKGGEEPTEPEFVRVRREQREPREPRDPKLRVEEQHSFLEWLKLKDIPVIPSERVAEYFIRGDMAETVGNKAGDQLIDQFIKTEPRIVPARSEFYSPGNMARQSAVDHEELISETLARIYAQQGNIPKAIDAYRRLSLKIPEKSSYFAALIKDLEQKDQS